MRDLMASILGASVKWLIVALTSVGTAYFAVESWVDTKVQAAESRVMFVRGLDMEHLNKRFDTLETILREKR